MLASPGPAAASRAARAGESYVIARWPRNRRAGRMPAMSQPAILPFVHAHGSPGSIGHTVGSMLAPLIGDHVQAWTRHVVAETGATRRAVLEAAAGFRAPIETHAPFLWEEIEGMARGSGLELGELLLLQAR